LTPALSNLVAWGGSAWTVDYGCESGNDCESGEGSGVFVVRYHRRASKDMVDARDDIIDGNKESDNGDGDACIKDCGLAHERINLPSLLIAVETNTNCLQRVIKSFQGGHPQASLHLD